MSKKRKLTPAERKARKQRKAEFMTVFIGGKQKRVRRPKTIDGLPVHEFLRRNADPAWLVQNEYYELLDAPPPEPLGLAPDTDLF